VTNAKISHAETAQAQSGLPRTEAQNPTTRGIDTWPVLKMLEVMNAEDHRVASAVAGSLRQIERAVDRVVSSLSSGGRVFYAGSGTSGRLAVLDASELPPTYGALGKMVIPLISGGTKAMFTADEGAEDNEAGGMQEIRSHGVCGADTVIGIASSGRTPFVVGVLKEARSVGAKTVAIVGDDSGPVAEAADLTIFVDVGPEVVTGSTRMKNGTAQKLILNMISTTAMIALGRTYSNLMAGTAPRNIKLSGRARRILSDASGESPDEAAKALEACDGELDVALVAILTGMSPDEARSALTSRNGAIRKTVEAALGEKGEAVTTAGSCFATSGDPAIRGDCVDRLPQAQPQDIGLDARQTEAAFEVVRKAVGDGEGDLPGAVAAIVRNGRIVGPRAFGWASREPERIAVTPNTVFDMASLTKVVATTPVILKLCEQGYFRLDDSLARFMPKFGQGGKDGITIRHLMTHTSGLPDHIRFWEKGLSGSAVIDYISGLPLGEGVIGLRVVYSDLGFIMLGELVRILTGKDLSEVAQETVFGPLGMADTCYRPDPSLRHRIAATEYRADLGRVMWGEVHDENALALGGIAGHAGLFSTAWDLCKYASMWLDEGRLNGTRVLSPSTVWAATKEHTAAGERRGLGWMLKSPTFSSGGDLISDAAFGHTGFTGTSLWCDPDVGVGIVLLTNRVHAGRDSNAAIRLRPMFANAVMAAVVE
jgi:N-acetylmuramic acid 6-phosphate etherase